MAKKLTDDDIIRALLNVAFYHSTGQTSLGDISNVLGIKKSSLYNHFENREDLIQKTTESCEEYLVSVNFIPNDYANVAKKYPVETVFKGIATRFFKMHEKSPFFQIYTFVESQKYFDEDAAKIIIEQKEKLILQTQKMLEALKNQNKIHIEKEKFYSVSTWFVSGLKDLISVQLLKRKKIVLKNPESGDGQLFTLKDDEESIEKINSFVEDFCKLL